MNHFEKQVLQRQGLGLHHPALRVPPPILPGLCTWEGLVRPQVLLTGFLGSRRLKSRLRYLVL